MKTDSELGRDVTLQLAWDPSIDDSSIHVSASDGVVTLTGEVRNYADKWEAEKIVKRVDGVKGIAEDLKVTLFGAKFNDTDLTERVVNSLRWNVSVPAEVQAMVRDGVVTLQGNVTWFFQKQAAESAVRYLDGVKSVIDLIKIDNPIEAQDVSAKITDALTRNARIDASNITVQANGHTAVLAGSVRSVAERDEAEMAAWSAPGVNSVQDRILVNA